MRRRAIAVLGAGGLVVVVLGTFLPWLRSGSATRNSYRAGGVARRLLHVPAWLSGTLHVWPFIGLLCAAVVALAAIELWRTAAMLGLITGAVALAVPIGLATIRSNQFAMPAVSGPVVTSVGAAAVVLASCAMLSGSKDPPHRS